MQVADKNPLYPLKMNMKFADLKLRSFCAIDQKQALIHIKQMSAWVSR
jgi:hypothetical protein